MTINNEASLPVPPFPALINLTRYCGLKRRGRKGWREGGREIFQKAVVPCTLFVFRKRQLEPMRNLGTGPGVPEREVPVGDP